MLNALKIYQGILCTFCGLIVKNKWDSTHAVVTKQKLWFATAEPNNHWGYGAFQTNIRFIYGEKAGQGREWTFREEWHMMT